MPLILFEAVKIDGDGPIVFHGDGARQPTMQQPGDSAEFLSQSD